MAEAEDVRLRGAVYAVQVLHGDGHRRGDVDDGALAARHEGRSGGVGQASEGGDVQIDHRLHLVDVSLQDRGDGAGAGVVDQHGDVRILAKNSFDLGQARLV